MRRGAKGARFFHGGNTVLTQHTQLVVSVASRARSLALAGLFVVSACAGPRYSLAQMRHDVTPGGDAVLEFDNLATMYVDVYLAAGQIQWRLGRVLPGMRATLTVPESAVDWPTGLMQLVAIPGSLMSAEAWRDARAVPAAAQPLSEVLSHRWTFRQPAGAALQLQATRLVRRE